MKNYYTSGRLTLLLICILFCNIPLYSQEYCLTIDDESNARSAYTCEDLDDLSLDEVLAMPLLNIPVVFHFIAYDEGLNFTCDPLDAILTSMNESAWLMWAPTFINLVVDEMNDRMTDFFRHSGIYSDSRVRYHLPHETACDNFYFYDHTTSLNDITNIPNTLNVVFYHDDAGCCQSGYTSTGNNRITILNTFRHIYTNENNDTYNTGRLINHENGHRFSLAHSFACNNPCNNVANDGGSVTSGPPFSVNAECC